MPNGWNKEALPLDLQGKLNIVHYALYKKPWQYDDVINGEYFWHYADKCEMKEQKDLAKNNFDDEAKRKEETANIQIV